MKLTFVILKENRPYNLLICITKLSRKYNATDSYNQIPEEKENLASIRMVLVFHFKYSCLGKDIFEHNHFLFFWAFMCEMPTGGLILIKMKKVPSVECTIILYIKSIEQWDQMWYKIIIFSKAEKNFIGFNHTVGFLCWLKLIKA